MKPKREKNKTKQNKKQKHCFDFTTTFKVCLFVFYLLN